MDDDYYEKFDRVPCIPETWYEKLTVWFLAKYFPELTLYRLKEKQPKE